MIRLLLLLLAVMPWISPLQAGLWDNLKSSLVKQQTTPPPTLELLIVHDLPSVILEVKGKYKVYDPHTNEHIDTRYMAKKQYIQALPTGIKWGVEFPGIYQLFVKPDEGVSTLIDGVEYKGSFYIYDIGGTISVVNKVDIEDYLRSILSDYSNRPLHKETYAAVAIAARTNAYYQMENPRNPYWAVDASLVNYRGESATRANTKIEQAINATKYMVMSLDKGVNVTETFANEWLADNDKSQNSNNAYISKISLTEADELANKEDHAAQILGKAFPKTTITLTHSLPESSMKAVLPADRK